MEVYYDKMGLISVPILWIFGRPQVLGVVEATSLFKLKVFLF